MVSVGPAKSLLWIPETYTAQKGKYWFFPTKSVPHKPCLPVLSHIQTSQRSGLDFSKSQGKVKKKRTIESSTPMTIDVILGILHLILHLFLTFSFIR
jgi:hypothetical protein